MVALIDQQALQGSLPRVTGTVRVAGLNDKVEIHRDRWGIPHAKASNLADAFFAQGFFTAQDRLWQMEYDRRRGGGRWAEVVGEGAVDQDVLMRRFRLVDSAKEDYRSTKGDTRLMFDAYAQGVNAFIQTTESLPVEYGISDLSPEPWEPWDGLVVYKVRHILMGVFESKIWRAQVARKLGPEKAAIVFPGYEPGHLLILPPGEVYQGALYDGLEELSRGAASLNYLHESDLGQQQFRTGRRPHQIRNANPGRRFSPGVGYPQCLLPESRSLSQISTSWDCRLPGCPGSPTSATMPTSPGQSPTPGPTTRTFTSSDSIPNTPSSTCTRTAGLPAQVYDETIKVKDGESRDIKSVVTHHGPAIAGDPETGAGVSFKYTATEGPESGASAWTDVLLTMLRSGDAHELVESMRDWVDPVNNFLLADVKGNFGYLCRGRIPIRSMANAWLPAPGWTGEHEWSGYIPFKEMPRSLNPESGYVATANNRPVGEDYPHYIALDFTPGFRAERVTRRLLSLDRPSAADMAEVHREMVSAPAQAYVGFLQDVTPENPEAARAKAKLLGWNCRMDAAAVEPTIYSAFRDALLKDLLEAYLGPELAQASWKPEGRGLGLFLGRLKARLIVLIAADDRRMIAPRETWQGLMSRALTRAVAELTERLGGDMDSGIEAWQWGHVHQARPAHTLSASRPDLADLLNPPPIPSSGDGDTPLAGGYAAANFAAVTSLSVARYSYDTADWENSLWVVPLGASGHPGSPHYHDQSEAWRKVEMVPMEYDWAGIADNSETQQHLEPA